jgi:hypothetical protein
MMTRKFAKELAESKQAWATVNEARERAMESEKRKIRCSWEGCWRTTARPYSDGWGYLGDWGPAVKDGWYCKAHADALEKVLEDGGFADENGR